MWANGDPIVLRYWNRDRISTAMPVIVVEDSPETVALYTAVDTPLKRRQQWDGTPIPRSLSYEARQALPWRLGDAVWYDNATLMLTRPGAAHAFVLFWREIDWSFVGWYVNLQAPLVRPSVGFDSVDHILDLVVAPDLTWRRKDEDEFADAQRLGRFTPSEAAAIRAEGEAVVETIEACAWPLNHGWESWRPDPAWQIPSLPEDWDAD